MTRYRPSPRASRVRALLALAALALLLAACDPFTPGTPTPVGGSDAGGTALGLVAHR